MEQPSQYQYYSQSIFTLPAQNDILEKIKKNTKLEIALIGNSAVMSSTKWGGEENLETLPVQYLYYQNLLKNEDSIKKITYGGKSFVVSAKKVEEH